MQITNGKTVYYNVNLFINYFKFLHRQYGLYYVKYVVLITFIGEASHW